MTHPAAMQRYFCGMCVCVIDSECEIMYTLVPVDGREMRRHGVMKCSLVSPLNILISHRLQFRRYHMFNQCVNCQADGVEHETGVSHTAIR